MLEEKAQLKAKDLIILLVLPNADSIAIDPNAGFLENADLLKGCPRSPSASRSLVT